MENKIEFSGRDKITYIVIFIFGLFIGWSLKGQGDKLPYDVWLDTNNHINIIQEKSGLVHTYAKMPDGDWEHLLSSKKRNKNE
ncbi:MAG: hypothetical protein WCA42_05105 [Desulfobacterales bacterium]